MSILSLVLKICVVIFFGEAVIMVALGAALGGVAGFLDENAALLALLDTVILTAVSAPIIFLWAVRPFVLARDEVTRQLAEENRRFAEAQRIGRVGSWQYCPSSASFEFSDEACRILEIEQSNDRIALERYLNALAEDDRRAAELAHAGLVSRGEAYNLVNRIVGSQGQQKWMRTRGEVERAADGADRMAGTFHDITEQRKAENTKSLFVAKISHELRTPMTSIQGSLALIQSEVAGPLPERVKDLVGMAHRNCGRLLGLVDDILDVKKIEAGKMDFHMAVIDLAALVIDAVEANQDFAREYGVSFNVLVHHRPALVNGDGDRLVQVMNNLLSNAVKFSPKGKSVDVSLIFNGTDIIVSVTDHGPGIPKQAQAAVFEEYVQAESTGQKGIGGTGLGLSIAKQIVDHHGGVISFTSEEGKGTKFYVKLKPHREPAETAA